MDILDKIVKHKRRALAEAKKRVPLEALVEKARSREPRDFQAALSRPGISVIAECKRASPSAGLIREDYDPVALCRAYERAGAAALSILTEERYFRGSLDHLARVREEVSLPLLRKDFILDEYQVVEAAAAGADAVLLIARVLGAQCLAKLVELCYKMDLSPLVEIYGEDDLVGAVGSGARILGINNRDLATLEVDIGRTPGLRAMIPGDRIIVSESGIRSAADIRRLAGEGVDAFLIGESLLKGEEPGGELEKLLAG